MAEKKQIERNLKRNQDELDGAFRAEQGQQEVYKLQENQEPGKIQQATEEARRSAEGKHHGLEADKTTVLENKSQVPLDKTSTNILLEDILNGRKDFLEADVNSGNASEMQDSLNNLEGTEK